MTVFKTLSASLVLLCVSLSPSLAQNSLEQITAAGKLQAGWAEWRPMEYRDTLSGDLKGVLINFVELVAERMNVEPEFVQDNWSTLSAGIAAGKFQVAMMGITDARAKVLDFTQPVYHVPFTVVVKDGSIFQTFDEVNVAGNSIAVTTGSSTDEVLTALQRDGKLNADVVRLKDVGGALLSVSTGKSTSFASSVDALSQIVEQQKALRIVEGAFGASIFAFAHGKGQPELNAALNEAIAALIADGTIAETLAEYAVAGSVAGASE